jgi:hypothetical protein
VSSTLWRLYPPPEADEEEEEGERALGAILRK